MKSRKPIPFIGIGLLAGMLTLSLLVAGCSKSEVKPPNQSTQEESGPSLTQQTSEAVASVKEVGSQAVEAVSKGVGSAVRGAGNTLSAATGAMGDFAIKTKDTAVAAYKSAASGAKEGGKYLVSTTSPWIKSLEKKQWLPKGTASAIRKNPNSPWYFLGGFIVLFLLLALAFRWVWKYFRGGNAQGGTWFQGIRQQFSRLYHAPGRVVARLGSGLRSSMDHARATLRHMKPPVSRFDSPRSAQVSSLPLDESTPFGRLAAEMTHLAAQHGKTVRVELDGPALSRLAPEQMEQILPAAREILENAIVHGVENPEERQARGKTTDGLLKVDLVPRKDGWMLSLSDDGAGINLRQVEEKARTKGMLAQPVKTPTKPKELLKVLFNPAYRDPDRPDTEGLPAVWKAVENSHGRLRIITRRNVGTRVKLFLPKAS
ncbi:MAG: hypothetical protein OEV94_07615 [Deltaproteobacteria bacterium]|nr:hypothetical protein [Deltaproteobacteria bacterium]